MLIQFNEAVVSAPGESSANKTRIPLSHRIYMKNLLPIIAALISFIMPFETLAKAPENPSGFVIHRGINLSHWLSQDFGWVPRLEWITENDFRYIASLGFDHVRLPVDEIELWHEDGTRNEEAFSLMITAIGWSRDNNLRVIVDLHTVRSHHFNAINEGGHNTLWTDPAAQEHFIDLWRDLTASLKDYPNDFLAYEIMNEATAEDSEDWNKLVDKSMKFIRSIEPGRVVVIGANMFQIPQYMPLLKVPEGDKNIILSLHTYAPLLFTHHTAGWIEGPIQTYTGPVSYPGPIIDQATFDQIAPGSDGLVFPIDTSYLDDWGPARFRQEIEPAIAKAKELGLQLYCGEFGCLTTVPREDRLAYYRDLIGVFESENIAWAPWEYKGDFGIFEWHGLKSLNGAPDLQLLDAMMQR